MPSVVRTDYTKWPNHLFACRDLSANGRLVALSLLRYADDDGECWPSQQTIARETGMGRKTVNHAVNELRRFGLKSYWKCRPGAAQKNMHYNVSELRQPSEDVGASKCQCGKHRIRSITKTQRAKVSVRHSSEFQNDPHACVESTHYTDTVINNHLNSAPASPSLGVSDGKSVPVVPGRSGDQAFAVASAPSVSECQAKPASPPTSGSDARAGGMVENPPVGAATAHIEKSASTTRLGRSTVQSLRLAPEGHSFDSATDPEQDVREILARVDGESPNRGALQEFDLERVWFHAQWLPRRIAFEFERTGRPVAKPTAFLMAAIRKDLPIQTDWPEYDFDRHNPHAVSTPDLDGYVRLLRMDKTDEIPSELIDAVRDLATAQIISEMDGDVDLPF